MYKNFICSIFMIAVIATEASAQERSYRRIFPDSVSPQTQEMQARNARLEMESEVDREKRLAEQESQEKAMSAYTKKGPVVPIGKKSPGIYYKISVNDKLHVSVWRVPELSLDFTVGPDGYISYPLIGDIEAAGKTLSELDAEITGKLKEYVENPQVSIVMKEFAGDRVTVIGEVENPGIYKFIGRAKIIDVIALAGGFTDRAKIVSIVIVREPDDPEKDVNLIVVDAKSILKGRYKNNIEVQPYDIVYVSRTFVSNAFEFYTDWITPAVNTVMDIESLKSMKKSRMKTDSHDSY